MNKFTNVLAIHCHTTGLNFNGTITDGHQPLSVSLAVLDTDTLKVIDSINVMVKFNPEKVKWNTELEAIHGITVDEAMAGSDYRSAAEQLGVFIAEHFGVNKKIGTFGFNVKDFHLPFLEKILHSEGLMFTFDTRAIDLFPIATLLGKFSIYDMIDTLLGSKITDGPISSQAFILIYTKIYKMMRLLVKTSIGS